MRSKIHINVTKLIGELTEDEKLLNDQLGRLSHTNEVLKKLNSSIDTINAETVSSILEKIPDEQTRAAIAVILAEMPDFLTKISQETDKCFNAIKKLLENKSANIQINKQDSQCHVSLLHAAAGIGSFKLVDLFFRYGSNPYLRNCFEQTPAVRARFHADNAPLADHLENLQKTYLIQQAYTQGAAAGVLKCGIFSNKISEDLGRLIGSFLGKKDGRALAETNTSGSRGAKENSKDGQIDIVSKAKENLAKARENFDVNQKESTELKELARDENSRLRSNANPGSNRYSCFQAAKVAGVVTTVAASLCLIASQF